MYKAEKEGTIIDRSQAPSEDTFSPSTGPVAPAVGAGKISIDRFEMERQWSERTEEEQAERAAELYVQAVRQRMPASAPDAEKEMDFEQLEAISQELKLQQKCQDIAALMMVDEMAESADDDDA